MKKLLFYWLIFLSLTFTLCAQSLYEEGVQSYEEGDYTRSFYIFSKLYSQYLDEDAAYYIARMYDNGEGIDQNSSLAVKWYKIAAQRYFEIQKQEYNHIYNKQRRSAVLQLDKIEDNDTRRTLKEMMESRFEFKAHKANYFLPFGYQKSVYDSYVASDVYTNIEAEFQFSIRFDLASNLLGLHEVYSAAYTQRSFWQIYAPSAPFRETNYTPELFVMFPVLLENRHSFIRAVTLGLAHNSNGQGTTTVVSAETLGNRSRSWNFAYLSLYFPLGAVMTELKLWNRYDEPIETDDNPDLTDYLGHGSLSFTLPYKKLVSTLMLRYNSATDRGAAELTLSYPVIKRDNIFWYAKIFSGYGESLIDYDNTITKSSFGVSFSR